MVTTSVNRRTIDQTVISPDITTLLKQKMTGYQLLIVILEFWASHQLNKNTTVGASTNYSIYKSDEKQMVVPNLTITFTKDLQY
jgi:hypothetical protein